MVTDGSYLNMVLGASLNIKHAWRTQETIDRLGIHTVLEQQWYTGLHHKRQVSQRESWPKTNDHDPHIRDQTTFLSMGCQKSVVHWPVIVSGQKLMSTDASSLKGLDEL